MPECQMLCHMWMVYIVLQAYVVVFRHWTGQLLCDHIFVHLKPEVRARKGALNHQTRSCMERSVLQSLK